MSKIATKNTKIKEKALAIEAKNVYNKNRHKRIPILEGKTHCQQLAL